MTDEESESKKKETKDADDCIFSKENVNLGHQPEIDYLKTLAVFSMTLDHAYLHFNTTGYLYYIIELIVNFLTAGALMFLMGINMKYSRNHDPKRYLNRSIVLLTMAQYFYLIRNCLPNLIAWWATGNKKFISRTLLILQTDILTFAGFSLLLIWLLKKNENIL